MCLELTIQVEPGGAPAKIGPRRLSQETGLCVTSFRTADGRKTFHLAAHPGCSCDLLHESFEINSASWPLEANAGPALLKAVSLIASEYPSFVFSSAYLGSEEPPSIRSAALSEILAELAENRLSAHLIRQVSAV
jgi:hypothetical protein